jgi:3-phosphoshikimate 1-carboxyvinyltransferase
MSDVPITPYPVQPLTHPCAATVHVPGSKSQTNRALLLAALAAGESLLRTALFSDDTRVFVDSLQRLGFTVEADSAAEQIRVHGLGGRIPATRADLAVGNAGTAARFLTALLPLGHGTYTLDGTPRMRQRPIAELLVALTALGATAEALEGNDCPPVRVRASGLPGGAAHLDASRSGQFLSALLMVGPYAARDIQLTLESSVASAPYIEMTLAMMRTWGMSPLPEPLRDRSGYLIHSGGRYQARTYDVPPDASAASYFLAAAAVSAGRVRVCGLARATEQGDLGFLEVLAAMGCTVRQEGDDVVLIGPAQLQGIEVDLNAMSDMALTLAAIAPFASGPVAIHNVAHIRHQETDRITAAVSELRRLGAHVEERPDGLTVLPGLLHGARIHTYGDHRMAMSFAVTGLRVPGIEIEDPGCTAKTFPDFFTRLEVACAATDGP